MKTMIEDSGTFDYQERMIKVSIDRLPNDLKKIVQSLTGRIDELESRIKIIEKHPKVVDAKCKYFD